MGVSMLLKSWATPPVSWPMVSSFCAWCSAASARMRSATVFGIEADDVFVEVDVALRSQRVLVLVVPAAP